MKTFDQTILLVPDTGFRMFFFPLGPDPFGVIDPEIRAAIIANRAACTTLASGEQAEFGDPECPWVEKVTNYLTSSWTEALEMRNQDTIRKDVRPHRLKYLRYRFGVCRQGNEEVVGLWIAVETNLGTVDRGWAYAIAHIRGGDDLGYDWYLKGKAGHRCMIMVSCDTSCLGDRVWRPRNGACL